MAEEWHYAHDGKQIGPVSPDELRRLAASGQLQPSDLIWKNGMAKWAPASRLKGLFPSAASTNPSPPPLDPVAVHNPAPPPLDSNALENPTLADALKTAGGLAAKQADKARLTNFSLPAAYHRLGKAAFDSNIGREVFAPQFSEIDELQKQLAAVGQHADAQSTTSAKGFAKNVVAMAQSAADAAKRKMLTVKLDHAVTRLGKSAYEQRSQLGLPQQQIDAIDALHRQVSSLDEDIQLTTVPKPAWSMLDNRIVHSVLALCCFPIGLLLIWKSGLWSKKAKLIWTGAVAFLFVVGLLAPKEELSHTSSDGASFSAAQLQEIAHDPNLKIAHSMGHLNHQKLEHYVDFKRVYESDGHKLTGTAEYTQLLILVPSKEWPTAAHKRGLSSTEYYQTTNLILATVLVENGYDLTNKELHNKVLFEMTGKHLEDY